MIATTAGFHRGRAPCGRMVGREHYEDQDTEGLVSDNWYYACGCRIMRQEYHDGSVGRKVVRHNDAVLSDELIAEHCSHMALRVEHRVGRGDAADV